MERLKTNTNIFHAFIDHQLLSNLIFATSLERMLLHNLLKDIKDANFTSTSCYCINLLKIDPGLINCKLRHFTFTY